MNYLLSAKNTLSIYSNAIYQVKKKLDKNFDKIIHKPYYLAKVVLLFQELENPA